MPITRFLRWIGAFAVALALGAGAATAADESDPERDIGFEPTTSSLGSSCSTN